MVWLVLYVTARAKRGDGSCQTVLPVLTRTIRPITESEVWFTQFIWKDRLNWAIVAFATATLLVGSFWTHHASGYTESSSKTQAQQPNAGHDYTKNERGSCHYCTGGYVTLWSNSGKRFLQYRTIFRLDWLQDSSLCWEKFCQKTKILTENWNLKLVLCKTFIIRQSPTHRWLGASNWEQDYCKSSFCN